MDNMPELNEEERQILDAEYYVDDFGFLWHGPIPGGEGFRYQRFNGLFEDGSLNWLWICYDPEPDWCEIPFVEAMKVLARFKEEFKHYRKY